MVRAIMIVEMAGKPAEHVKESLERHINFLKDFTYTETHSITVSEPKEIEGSEGVFTCFAETDFETDTFANLANVMFDFMPSSIEVIEPANINMGTQDATNLLNNISGRMHRYDDIAKLAQMKINEMTAQLQATQEALIEKDVKKPTEGQTKKAKGKKAVKKRAVKKGVGKKSARPGKSK